MLRNINLTVQLHTAEQYQDYFRRRLANIIGAYCEQRADECRGVLLAMDQVSGERLEAR